MLCDTGPLVALVDADDPFHHLCTQAAERLPPMMVTTWPCLTEAMHFLFRAGGLRTQNNLWAKVAEGVIKIHIPAEADWKLVYKLINQYADMPLDLADASLVGAAERLSDFQLFSLDASMRAVRILDDKFFDVIP